MARSVDHQNEYLIVVPDLPNSTSARVNAQPKHIKDAMPLIDAGKITYFGVTLTHQAIDSDVREYKSRIDGSTIVMKAENEAEVRRFLEQDAYTKAAVWDVKQARIWPFKSG